MAAQTVLGGRGDVAGARVPALPLDGHPAPAGAPRIRAKRQKQLGFLALIYLDWSRAKVLFHPVVALIKVLKHYDTSDRQFAEVWNRLE